MRLIDADAFLNDVMERYCEKCDRRMGIKRGKWRVIYEIGEAPCKACSVDDMKCELDDAPTIEPKHGKPIVYYHGENTFSYECSICRMPIDKKDYYCRWCGARIDGEKNE